MRASAKLPLILPITLLITSAVSAAPLGPYPEPTPAPAQSAPEPEPVPATAERTPRTSASINANASRPLGAARESAQPLVSSADPDKDAAFPSGMTRTILSLAGVLLVIFALAHIAKRVAKSSGSLTAKLGAGGEAPSGLVEILGRYPIAPKLTLVVMRFDRRILLLEHAHGSRGRRSSSGSMRPLTELTDPEDVASVVRKVQSASPSSHAKQFERTLRQLGETTDDQIQRELLSAQRSSPAPGVHVQSVRRAPSAVMTNDEGDRAELTGAFDAPAAGEVLKRRLGAMRRNPGGRA
jgi:flagellar biogenesis protein FliO